MRLVLFITATFLSLITLSTAYGQADPDAPVLIFSLDSIQKGIEMYDRGSYDSAITMFEYVVPNDSNYALAQYEKSLALTAQEKHEEALKTGLTALRLGDSLDPGYYTSVGNSYDDLGQPEKALALYNAGLERFPLSFIIRFNRAITYARQEEHQKALADLKRCAEINPFHASTHLQLAYYAVNQEQYAQALLSVGYFLMIEPNSGRTNSVLSFYNQAVSDRIELDPKNIEISNSQDDFKKTNLLIKSYAALRDDYEVDSDLDIALVRQMDLTIKQTLDLSNSNDFWYNYYADFYRAILDEDYFELYSYLLLVSSANESHQKVINKNSQDIIEFLKWARQQLRYHHGLHHEAYDQDNPEIKHWFFSDANRVEAIGRVNMDGEQNGDYTYYYQDGAIRAKGSLTDGLRQGAWKFYYRNGQPAFEGSFEDNELNGPATAYYSNGRLEKETNYKDGLYSGITEIHNAQGYLERVMFHVDGQIEDSLIYFFSNAKKSAFLPMKESMVDGEATYYYPDGRLSSRVMFVADKNNGPSTSFFRDSSISARSNYKDGMLHGAYESYYPNGQIESKGSYDMGSQVGKWVGYHYDGTLASKAEYDESGKENGHQEYYNSNGVLTTVYEYTRGEIKRYEHYDGDGNIIQEGVRRGGKFWYEDYNTFGIKISEGNYYGDHKEGTWKYYTSNGILSGVEPFNEKGRLHGRCEYFHENGKLSGIRNYQNDTLNKLYRQYYKHGQLREQGNYLRGNMEGIWETYYPDGTLSTLNFYHNGSQNGRQLAFDPEGSLRTASIYQQGQLITLETYDADSSLVHSIDVDIAKDTLISRYPNGEIAMSITYRGGEFNGKALWKHANGELETEGEYINGNRHGTWRYYYPDGTLDRETHYHLGVPVGKWRYYYRNGELRSITNYENGEQHGEESFYHPNGKLDSKGTNNQGVLDGKRYFYDYQGRVDHIRFYDHGRKMGYSYLDENGEEVPMIPLENETGEVKSYYQNGQLSREYAYKNGNLTGDYVEYNYNGTIRSKMTFIDDEYHGDLEVYDEDGELIRKLNYENGSLNGPALFYHTNGKLARRAQYVNDELHGITEKYDENGKLVSRYLYRGGDLYEVLPLNED